MKNVHVNKTKTNLLIDILIFVIFLIVYEVKATGETIHEWLGITIGFIFIIHIILHWKWIVITTKQFLTRIKAESRLNYIVDILIFIGFTTIIFTGLMISKSILPTFGIQVAENHFWREMHSISVDLTLFLTAFHFALHWEWIVNNFKRFILSPLKNVKSTKRLPEPEIIRSNESKSSHLLSFVKLSGKFFSVLIFSSIISTGWYAISGMISAEPNNREYGQTLEQNMDPKLRTNADKRLEQFDSEYKHHFNNKGQHDEGGFFILEILKNLFIFTLVTLLVSVVGKKINKKNAEQELEISSQK